LIVILNITVKFLIFYVYKISGERKPTFIVILFKFIGVNISKDTLIFVLVHQLISNEVIPYRIKISIIKVFIRGTQAIRAAIRERVLLGGCKCYTKWIR
jgi:hypothetical protein